MTIKNLMIRFSPDKKSFWVAFRLLEADWIGRCFEREFKANELESLVAGWETWAKLPPQEVIEFEKILAKMKDKAP